MRFVEGACLASALALLASPGCRGPLEAPIPAAHPDDDAPRRGGTLRLASFQDVSSLDPAIAFDALSVSVVRLVYAGLVDFDARGDVVPDLATRIDVVDGGRTYRFPLREGARFHDGAEVTAIDVKRSMQRALSPDTASPAASYFGSILSIDAEGRYLVTIRLREPDSTFLRALAMTALRPICPGTADPGASPCGAGPFQLAKGAWQRGQEIRLARFDRYYRPGEPYLDAIAWQLNTPVTTQAYLFARGDLDATHDLTQADTLRYLEDPRWKALGEYEPARSVSGDAMNVEIPPFDNVEVRRAVAAAIDRDAIALLKSTNLTPATKPVPEGIAGYTSDVRGQAYDLEAARAHMRRAGLPDGWPAVIPYYVYRPGVPEMAGQVIQQELAKIGLRLELRATSYPTYLAITHRRGKAAISPQAQTEDYPDPSDFLEPLFTKAAINDDDTSNFSFYVNDALDRLLARARRTVDDAERARMYADAERIVCDEAPWAFEYSYRFFHVHQPYVRGYAVHAVWAEDPARVWIDRDAGARVAGARRALGPILGDAR
jgi:ABC-type transport system substrate-binding protein